MANFFFYWLKLEMFSLKSKLFVRPCKINYLVLGYRCVGKKLAAVLYLSPNKNKCNSKKVHIQISRLLTWIDQRETTVISRWRNSEHSCVFLWLYEVVTSEVTTQTQLKPKDWTNMHNIQKLNTLLPSSFFWKSVSENKIINFTWP